MYLGMGFYFLYSAPDDGHLRIQTFLLPWNSPCSSSSFSIFTFFPSSSPSLPRSLPFNLAAPVREILDLLTLSSVSL